ncbi:MAG: hypothetical protein ACOCV2_09095 [Persicimonas sp.]
MGGTSPKSITHAAAGRALEALFVGRDADEVFEELPAAAVYRHLRECDECRQRYDALALADRRLLHDAESSDAKPAEGDAGEFEAAFGEASFGEALDVMLEAEAAETPQADDDGAEVVSVDSKRGFFRDGRARFAAAAAVVLAAAGLFWSSPELFDGRDDADFAPRSATAPDDGDPAQPELEVFCAERSAQEVDLTGADRSPLGLVDCPLDAEIQLAYRNRADEFSYAAFFGVDRRGTIYWYGPTPAAQKPLPVEASSELEPAGESIRLEVNHRPGSVRVIGLFGDEPIGFEALERRVEGLDTEALYEGEADFEASGETMTTESFEITDGGSR